MIIANYNRADLLAECLESIVGQTLQPLEILVVDNASSDRSCEVAMAFSERGVRLIRQTRNLGFAGGNNVGIRQARGDWIALINNDAVAEPDWLENLAAVVSHKEKVGMCASRILLLGDDLIDKAGHLMYADGQNRGRGTGERDRGQYDKTEEAFFPDGCAALYRRELLRDVGGFDEDFFAYADDADLGVRARLRGWKCLYAPRAVVHHHQSATSGNYSEQKVYWVERNRIWLAVKSFPLPLLLLNPLLTANRLLWNSLAAASGRGAAANFRRNVSWPLLFLTLARAYRDALRGLPAMWSKRRRIRARRRISDRDFYRLLLRFRVSARVLAFRDPDLLVRSDSEIQSASPGLRRKPGDAA